MNRKLEIIKNLLAEILNYSFWFAAGAVLLEDFIGIPADKAGLWAVGITALFLYVVREKCRKFPVFLLLHLLPAAAFWVLYQGNIFLKMWIMLVTVFLAGSSFGKKLSSADMGMNAVFPPVYCGFMWLLYLIDSRRGGGCAGLLLYTVIGYAAGYFGYYFLRQFLHYMDINNRTTENIPFDRVLRSSALLAGGFIGLAGIIMVLGADGRIADRIGGAIRRALIGGLSFLLSLLPRNTDGETDLSSYQGGGGPMPWDSMEPSEPSLVMKILEVLLGVFAIGAVVILIFLTVLGVVRFIRSSFARKRTVHGIPKDAHEDQVERLRRRDAEAGKKRGESFWSRAQRAITPEERIRRIYKRAIEKKLLICGEKKRRELTRAQTPREWCVRLFPEQEGKALEFAGLYEKARYGAGMCDSRDVKRARKLAEEFHKQERESI